MKIMKIIEFHEHHKIPLENHKTNEDHIIPIEHHESLSKNKQI